MARAPGSFYRRTRCGSVYEKCREQAEREVGPTAAIIEGDRIDNFELECVVVHGLPFSCKAQKNPLGLKELKRRQVICSYESQAFVGNDRLTTRAVSDQSETPPSLRGEAEAIQSRCDSGLLRLRSSQ
jgi:hypothetical protein